MITSCPETAPCSGGRKNADRLLSLYETLQVLGGFSAFWSDMFQNYLVYFLRILESSAFPYFWWEIACCTTAWKPKDHPGHQPPKWSTLLHWSAQPRRQFFFPLSECENEPGSPRLSAYNQCCSASKPEPVLCLCVLHSDINDVPFVLVKNLLLMLST